MQILAVVVGLLCLSIYYNSSSSIKSSPFEPKSASVDHAHREGIQPVSQADELPELKLLDRSIPAFEQSRRNVFEYSNQEEDVDITQSSDGNLEPPAEQTESEPETPPGSEITFVGLYVEKNKPESRLAILSVNKNILIVKAGDIVPGGYRVINIESDSVILQVIGQKLVLRYTLGSSGVPLS